MRRLVILSVFWLVPVQAQTPPALQWNAPSNAATAVEAQGLTYTLYVNGGAGVAVSGATCAGVIPFDCTAPVPAGTPTAIGTRLELTAKTATSVESDRSLPFISPPSVPTNLRRK